MADKIVPDSPEFFLGKPELFMEWASQKGNWRDSPQFCARHWMPCPVEGKPGLLVTVIIMTESFGLMPPGVTTPEQMNSWQANMTTPYCCQFGDEKMDWLWWLVGITDDESIICRAQKPKDPARPENIRVCWRLKDHEGIHEWERPFPRSIFDLMEEVHP